MMESVEEFSLRAESWLAENIPLRGRGADGGSVSDEDRYAQERMRQRQLFDAGLAGICFPKAYGGQGLDVEFQRAFNAVSVKYDVPVSLNFPTLAICAPTIMDLGTEHQRREHLPAVLRGDEVICQLLSEPGCGSDLAGLRTRGDWDGGRWRITGSKVWSSGAHVSDYGFLLVRTNWDVPKHHGLTMFLLNMRQPGITVRQIRQVNGASHFCEVFFDRAVVEATGVVGDVNDGWAVAKQHLAHERVAMGGGSPYVSGVGPARRSKSGLGALGEMARRTGRQDDPRVREMLGEAHALIAVRDALVTSIGVAMRTGRLPPSAAALLRIQHAATDWRLTDIGIRIAGSAGVVSAAAQDPGLQFGNRFLMRQATSIGGGTTEMALNMISEQLLGMPREPALDKDVPFREVRGSKVAHGESTGSLG